MYENKLENIIAYLCTHYPHKQELSKARLTKLVYLSDWFSALIEDKTMTDIDWVFNHYGPYVDKITDIARASDKFKINYTQTQFGGDKYLISYIGESEDIEIEEDDKAILDFVINKTKGMYFDQFIDYVYSTYPIKSNERYATLDLKVLANEYNQILKAN